MSNYTQNLLNLPLDSLIDIRYCDPQKINGCNIMVIKVETIRKDTNVCDKCGTVHKHAI